MRTVTKFEVRETKGGYTLTKEAAKRFSDRWEQAAPTLKRTVWGTELRKPLYYVMIEPNEANYCNTFGWVFEEDGKPVSFSAKENAKLYAKQ